MRSIPEPRAAAPKPDRSARKNPLSPKKLLLTKWTAVTPRSREKHFVVLRVIEPEPPSERFEQIELEAVHSKQVYLLHWRELTDASVWRQGWV
jgi:tryptophan-rich hypothetical protein